MSGETLTSQTQPVGSVEDPKEHLGAPKTTDRPEENGDAESSDAAERRAAQIIQKHYRGHAGRKRAKSMQLWVSSTSSCLDQLTRRDKDARWEELMKKRKEEGVAEEQLENKNDVKSRWRRGVLAAARLQAGDGLTNAPIEEEEPYEMDEETRQARKATMWGKFSINVGKERDENQELPYSSKALEQQHWLEMIDGKHRYGSNLKHYFKKWKESETEDNFFRWLDRGDGKNLDLDEVSRERLEEERITYLSAEQRLNYLVKVDRNGLLRWGKNEELVDTAAGKWRDAGPDEGIVPDDTFGDETIPEEERPPNPTRRSSTSSLSSMLSDSYSASSSLQDNEDTHYAGFDAQKDKGWLGRKFEGVTPAGVRRQILRRTVRRNTWIYVSDMKMNLFIGIKNTGDFQHSSFLGGGKVTSAGIIVVKQGVIKSLNPWSGHYRSTIQAYRSFIAQLENKGADLSHVKVAKSIALMWGLSKHREATKGSKDLGSRFKAVLGLDHSPTEQEKSEELEKNAEKEEVEHQERIRRIEQAEENAGESDVERQKAKREVLYGRKRAAGETIKEEGKHEEQAQNGGPPNGTSS